MPWVGFDHSIDLSLQDEEFIKFIKFLKKILFETPLFKIHNFL